MPRCERCNDSGEIAVSIYFPMPYVGPGPVPDDARHVCAAPCDACPGTEPCARCEGEGCILPPGSGDEDYINCPDCEGTGDAP